MSAWYDALLIVLRVSLALLAYYNAKMMYSHGENEGVSPLFVTYLTHSVISFFILQDILVKKMNYLASLRNNVGDLKKFLVQTCILSLIFNLSHIPKYFAMNKLSDVFIVSVGCLSVHTTYWVEKFIEWYSKSNKNRQDVEFHREISTILEGDASLGDEHSDLSFKGTNTDLDTLNDGAKSRENRGKKSKVAKIKDYKHSNKQKSDIAYENLEQETVEKNKDYKQVIKQKSDISHENLEQETNVCMPLPEYHRNLPNEELRNHKKITDFNSYRTHKKKTSELESQTFNDFISSENEDNDTPSRMNTEQNISQDSDAERKKYGTEYPFCIDKTIKAEDLISLFKNISLSVLSLIGTILVFLDECKRMKQFLIGAFLVLGSICDGIYTVWLKKLIKNNQRRIIVKKRNESIFLVQKPFQNNTEDGLPGKIRTTEPIETIGEHKYNKNFEEVEAEVRIFPSKLQFHDDSQVQSDHQSMINQEPQMFLDKLMSKYTPKQNDRNKIENLIFIRHYLGLTGLITFLFYWPILILPLNKEGGKGGLLLLFHIFLSNILSVSQNVLYFFMITVKSPYFIQTSGLILQPSIVLIEMIRKMKYFTNRLMGFFFIFGTILFIG